MGDRLTTWLRAFYEIGALLAGVCLVGVAGLVIVQVIGRWSGLTTAGIPELTGYAMANSFFLPLAYAFRQGAHIRIRLFADRLSDPQRNVVELVVLAVGLVIAGALAIAMGRLAWISFMIGDLSQGADATPLWIPQLGLSIGSGLLVVAIGQTLWEQVTRFFGGLPGARVVEAGR